MAEIILINSLDNSNANSNMRTNLQNINETITNPSIVDNERQVKKSWICHPVWHYLSWDVNDAFITCNLCQQQYSPKTGVSTIKGHFMTNHKDEWAIIE